jgi:TATA-binding protein-associated factor Taf7
LYIFSTRIDANSSRTISKDIEAILSGAWDARIVPEILQPEVLAPLTASSSSSQLTPVDSPAPAKPNVLTADKTKEEESPLSESDEGMEVDGHDDTVQQEDSMDVDDVIADVAEESSAPAPAKEAAKETKVDVITEDQAENDEDNDEDAEGDGEDAEGEEEEEEEKKEDAPPARGLRNRKTLEPLEIPINTTGASNSPRKTRGRGGVYYHSMVRPKLIFYSIGRPATTDISNHQKTSECSRSNDKGTAITNRRICC